MSRGWKWQFAVIYAGQAFSLLGSAAVQFAIIWHLTVRTESAVTLTTATIVGFLPNLLFGPFAGVWIDRFNRRSVMIAADSMVAASSALLAAAFLVSGQPPVWFVYLVLFLRGVGNCFHSPAMQAAVPMLVPPEMLTKAGGWGNLIVSASSMAGPVLGAALMELLPPASVMLVDILGAAFAVVCLLFVRILDIPRSAEKPELLDDLKQGFAAIRDNPPLRAVFGPMVLVNLAYMPLGALFPLLIRSHFGGGAWHTGAAEFLFAGGLLVSSLIIGLWGGSRRRFRMVSLSIVVLGLGSAVSGALPPGGFVVFAALCVVMGGTGTFINVPMTAYTQETTPPEQMGKVFSLLMAAMALAMPIGLLVAGPVSELVGVDRWFLGSGVALAGVGLLCWARTGRYDRPLPHAAEPDNE